MPFITPDEGMLCCNKRPHSRIQVCVQPSTPAVNVTLLLAFAAERRAAAAPLLVGARRAAIDQYLLHKPAARCCSGQ